MAAHWKRGREVNNGVGFLGLLALIFIGLKLADVGVVAAWSWWWVLSPLWAPLALVVVVALPFYMAQAVRKQWRQR